MNIEEFRLYCLKMKGVTEGFPFGEGALVFKVMSKMFALAGLEDVPPSVNLKCAPERCIELREEYEAVLPGYHMNKRHWNTIRLDGSVPSHVMVKMIEHSYRLVVAGLRRGERTELERM